MTTDPDTLLNEANTQLGLGQVEAAAVKLLEYHGLRHDPAFLRAETAGQLGLFNRLTIRLLERVVAGPPAVTPITRPYTRDELRRMQEQDGEVSAVVSWSFMAGFEGDLDGTNDHVSAQITGSEVGLEDISYELVGVDLPGQLLLVRVSGVVENWLAYVDGEDALDSDDGDLA